MSRYLEKEKSRQKEHWSKGPEFELGISVLESDEKEDSCQRKSERSQGQLTQGLGGHCKDFGLYLE